MCGSQDRSKTDADGDPLRTEIGPLLRSWLFGTAGSLWRRCVACLDTWVSLDTVFPKIDGIVAWRRYAKFLLKDDAQESVNVLV